MVLIICNKIGGEAKVVPGITMNYTFHRGQPLLVVDPKDIKFFLDQVGEFEKFETQNQQKAKVILKERAVKEVKKDGEYKSFLDNIKGIGSQTLRDILMVAKNREKLVSLVNADKLPLRNDVVKLIKKALDKLLKKEETEKKKAEKDKKK